MKAGELAGLQAHLPGMQQRSIELQGPRADAQVKFSDTLSEFVQGVNELQKESGRQTEKFVKGEPVDLHDVMIAAEKAKTSFSLLMELRNKSLDMYREVIRIQV